ncbi:hypothetical protein BDW72DRAFT_188814 [Aspergillus terricola var. indicus]
MSGERTGCCMPCGLFLSRRLGFPRQRKQIAGCPLRSLICRDSIGAGRSQYHPTTCALLFSRGPELSTLFLGAGWWHWLAQSVAPIRRCRA